MRQRGKEKEPADTDQQSTDTDKQPTREPTKADEKGDQPGEQSSSKKPGVSLVSTISICVYMSYLLSNDVLSTTDSIFYDRLKPQ